MSISAFFFVCIQICLIQNAFTQYLSPSGPCGSGYDFSYGGPIVSPAGLATPYGLGAGAAAAPFGLAPAATPFGVAPAAIELGAYGGAGIGDVIVAGQMPVGGTTLVAGQVPILGSVRFAGDLPAAGTVSIAGSCGCGCGNAGYYY